MCGVSIAGVEPTQIDVRGPVHLSEGTSCSVRLHSSVTQVSAVTNQLGLEVVAVGPNHPLREKEAAKRPPFARTLDNAIGVFRQ